MKKKSGFTLSEVLIALTIIGVVAALATPRFIGNATKKQFIAKFKTTMNILDSAAKESKAEEGGYDYSGNRTNWHGSNNIAKILQEKAGATLLPEKDTAIWSATGLLYSNALCDLNGVAYSRFTVSGTCPSTPNIATINFGRSSTNDDPLGDSGGILSDIKYKTLKLKNGAYIYVDSNALGCISDTDGIAWYKSEERYIDRSTDVGKHNLCAGYIDVNGPKGPNKLTSCTGDGDTVNSEEVVATVLIWPNSNVTCSIAEDGSETGGSMSYVSVGDVFPIWFYNDSVAPANSAVNSVWLDKFDD